MIEPSLSARISREIENDILNGVFHQQERLDERALALRFGVSRTPIREALSKVVAQGLAEHRSKKGIFVSKINFSSVLELFEMLAVLESSAARLAARRLSSNDRAEILILAGKTIDAAERKDALIYTELNDKFHGIISAGSKNRHLEESINQLRRRVAPYRTHIHRIAGRRMLSAQEHMDIAKYISDEDADGEIVAKTMYLHLDLHRPEFADFLHTLIRSIES